MREVGDAVLAIQEARRTELQARKRLKVALDSLSDVASHIQPMRPSQTTTAQPAQARNRRLGKRLTCVSTAELHRRALEIEERDQAEKAEAAARRRKREENAMAKAVAEQDEHTTRLALHSLGYTNAVEGLIPISALRAFVANHNISSLQDHPPKAALFAAVQGHVLGSVGTDSLVQFDRGAAE